MSFSENLIRIEFYTILPTDFDHIVEIYEEAGVKEYWVVFPPEKNMLVYTLTNGKYVASPFLYAGDSVVSSVLPGFSLDLTLLFPAQP